MEQKAVLKTIVLASLTLLATGCNSRKQDEKIRSLESEVTQLKVELAELKEKPKAAPEHHYELRNEGFRTFRFDPTTGETCIQLTTPADWKRKETKSQSCACADGRRDWLDAPKSTDEARTSARGYYDFYVKPTCGE